jgi:hypothetical protein
MYYFLTQQIQRVFIEELRNYWSYHPRYKDIVGHIQGKYSFRERPQFGIVLKNSSGNQAQLAADNFQGYVHSYVYLANVEGKPGLSIEWVRENMVDIQNNGGVFPTAPGIYYIDFCDANGNPTDKAFYLDPLLNVEDETLFQINDTQYQLQNGRYLDGTLRLYRMPGNLQLYEGPNYTADPDNGEITLVEPLGPEEFLSADYRVPGETTGPWPVQENRALTEPLPGVVLAFGRRITPGDRLAVVVQPKRSISALEFGGRWDLTLDLDVIARDPLAQREILDQSALYLWATARPRLSSAGIEVLSIAMGGETEEVYDENADDWFYNASFSLQLQTDWSIHVPLGICIRGVEPGGGEPLPLVGPSQAPLTPPFIEQIAGLTDEQIAEIQTNIRGLANLGLSQTFDPWYAGKNGNPGKKNTGPMLR